MKVLIFNKSLKNTICFTFSEIIERDISFYISALFNPCRQDKIKIVARVFTNGPGDWSSIPGRVIPKTHKVVLDASLLNTQHYKVRIKGKVKQSKERNCVFPYTSVVANEKGALGLPLTTVANFTIFFFIDTRSTKK